MAVRLRPTVRLEGMKMLADRLRDRLGHQIRELSPTMVEDLKTLLRHPRSAAGLIDGRGQWLGRRFLDVASNVVEPFLAGMGLRVERLEEERIEVSMPGWWRNQGDRGSIHSAALVALAEFTARLFWEHHLDLSRSDMQLERTETRFLAQAKGVTKAILRLPVAEREAAFYKLRSEGETEVTVSVAIYDDQGRLVVESELAWRLRKRLALGART